MQCFPDILFHLLDLFQLKLFLLFQL